MDSENSGKGGNDTMQVQPYLFFEGRCDEALEFYRKALGAEVRMLMRYKEAPSVAAKDDADAKRKFGALSEGGQVKQALVKTFFASSFGMVVDRFGITWMVIAGAQ
jgi:PhnB protein